MKTNKTRFENLGFANCGKYWTFCDLSSDIFAQIGQHYKNKMELLADMQRFAEERGFDQQNEIKESVKQQFDNYPHLAKIPDTVEGWQELQKVK